MPDLRGAMQLHASAVGERSCNFPAEAIRGFGNKFWAIAEMLHRHMDVAWCTHVVSGMCFLNNLWGDCRANVTCVRHRGDEKNGT